MICIGTNHITMACFTKGQHICVQVQSTYANGDSSNYVYLLQTHEGMNKVTDDAMDQASHIDKEVLN